MPGITIEEEDACGVDGLALIEAATKELEIRYPELPSQPFDPTTLNGPRSAFFIARMEGMPVGCGGLRPYMHPICEFKRMFVAPAARRRGISRILLAALEEKSKALQYGTIYLETGIRQPEAIALYLSCGYTEIAGYGDFTEGFSVCMKKDINLED
jgi:putative acetyltransferase